jgi:hypothetical protein
VRSTILERLDTIPDNNSILRTGTRRNDGVRGRNTNDTELNQRTRPGREASINTTTEASLMTAAEAEVEASLGARARGGVRAREGVSGSKGGHTEHSDSRSERYNQSGTTQGTYERDAYYGPPNRQWSHR